MKKRFLLVALLLTLMLLASCVVALADDDVPPPDQISPNLHFSTYEWRKSISPFADDDKLEIVRTVASITKQSSTSVFIRGVTETNKICSSLGGFLIVQQWKNSKWNDYYRMTFEEFSTYTAECATTVTVEDGYYYRLVVQHLASRIGESANKLTSTGSVI